jgi:ABC-type nitrate/sulfonate/bicarbonate transport system substrate-binding protein
MNTLSKRLLAAGIIVLAVIGVVVIYNGGLFLTASENTPSASRPKITIGYNVNSLDTVPLIIAYQNGYFQDQGIDVQLVQVRGSEGALAVSSGQVDMVITGAPGFMAQLIKVYQ